MDFSNSVNQMDDVDVFDATVEIVDSDFDTGSPTLDVSYGFLGDGVEDATDNSETAHNDEASHEVKQDSLEFNVDIRVKDNRDDCNGGPQAAPATRLEVAIPEMPLARRNEYTTVYSDIVDLVAGAVLSSRDKVQYIVEFNDGREQLLTFEDLVEYANGKAALRCFEGDTKTNDTDMTRNGRKRKYLLDDTWNSGIDDVASDRMELDAEEDEDDGIRMRRAPTRQTRVLRSREASKRRSLGHDSVSSEGENDVPNKPNQPTRRLRTRMPQQLKRTSMAFKSSFADRDQDELSQEPHPPSDEDDDFLPVISDLATKKGRPGRVVQRSRRLQSQKLRSKRQAISVRKGSEGSDIEFEQPRRSSRNTRNTVNMRDDVLMDDDSFYVVDDKSPAAPKIISVREVFQPISPESNFGSVHMQLCHTCNGSKQRGQLLYCQGCSLAFHKNCIGYRSAREHMATKVGEDDFVLQCKFCIGLYKKKDVSAPSHSMCQGCKKDGKACAAFSQKKTSRQEEKLREENGGVDPITLVPSELINHADAVLFRCDTCHRGWHQEHLPSAGSESIGTDLKSERLKDYSVDWQCNECSTTKYKIHRLVAWRPTQQSSSQQSSLPAFADVGEDDKEYLIKWQDTSYAHCSWMSGAWVFGVAAGVMRTAFGKRTIEQELLKFSEKEAIPDEFLLVDIIFDVTMAPSASTSKSKEEQLANISQVSKIFVKYQGLGYDDVVWDSAPKKDNAQLYNAFLDAYQEYVEGKCFKSEPNSKIRERIKTYKNAAFTELDVQPAGLKRGKLMGYQVEGLNWLLQNYHQGRSVVLADEMGLGKTVQVVSLVTSLIQDSPRCWPFLIVVPNATCPNWRREFKQWAPDIRVVAYHGGKEPQDLAYKYELFPNGSTEMKAQVVIMSYDSAQDPRTQSLFKSVHWTGLIVDEGQRLKNDQNLLYLALRAMKIPFRLLLTGTPLQNNKRELFNLLQFIDETQNAEGLDMEYSVLDKHNLPKLHEKIRPYFLRRTKAGVLKFLPPMAQIILPVTMTVIQEKLSKSIMAKNPQLIKAMFANSKMNKKERGSLNNILMQLRKCLCHPFIYSDAIEERDHDHAVVHRNLVEASAKLLLLEIMLPKLKEQGHRVLIFSQFLQQLDIIEDFLVGMGYEFRRLDGTLSSLEKQRRIDAYNEPGSSIFAFLLSTRAGGVGINLATADTVIIMDPDFNPHQDIQALSRAHRIGQKNKVLCFQLMTKDSVEERIMQVGRKKMALDHALIESMDDDEIAGDDLESILKHGAQALFNEDYQKTAIHYDSMSVDKLLDRSQMEQTATNEEGSAETQFNYARVWANEKLGFEDNQDVVEEQAPEPINSSVWDQILAQREEEARREAEANREVLGRGARRRMAINYKTNAIENITLPGDVAPESSDSSDDFAGADSADDSDGEEDLSSKAERDGEIQSIREPTEPRPRESITFQKATEPDTKVPRKRGRPKSENKSTPNSSKVPSEAGRSDQGQQRTQEQNPHTVPIQHTNGVPNWNDVHRHQQALQHYQQYLKLDGRSRQDVNNPTSSGERVPNAPIPQPPPNTAPSNDLAYMHHLRSEAQLRLAIDNIQRSKVNEAIKEGHISALLHRLRELRMPNGTRQQ